MKNVLKCKGHQSKSSARVVDNKLILSFPHALSPVVWQMDLEKTNMAALEVFEDEKKKNYALILKRPENENQNIAAFESREDAVDAMMQASYALENAQGFLNARHSTGHKDFSAPQASAYASTGDMRSGSGKKIGLILAIVFVIALFGVWSSQLPRSLEGSAGGAKTAASANIEDMAGVPVSADEFLQGR